MKITNLKKTVGSFSLHVENLEIEAGKIHGISGHNGAGKSLLLKCIMGIFEPDSGVVDYEGLEPGEVTLLSQRPYLLHGSVYDNVVYPLKIRGIKPDEKEVDALLEKVGLLKQKKQYARSLSSGERQKLSFIRAIIFKPKFIMLDETLSNIDPESETLIMNMIKEIQKENPVTWLMVSHQLEQKKDFCDVIHRMEKGQYCGIIKG